MNAEREDRMFRETRPSAPHLVPDTYAPLSFAQQRLWILDRIQAGLGVYNVATALELSGPLQSGPLEQSLREVVRRHEALRTNFVEHGGTARQVIHADVRLSFSAESLEHLRAGERFAAAIRMARKCADRPFDLSRDPLIRSVLYRIDVDHHLLLVAMHHIVSDGWSLTVLLREVAALYAAFAAGQRSPLPDLSIQYADFARSQRSAETHAKLEEDLAYWRERLANMTPLQLRFDKPRPPAPSYSGDAESLMVQGDLVKRLKEIGARRNATLFMMLLGAYQLLLHRYSSQNDVIVGAPIAYRNRLELEQLIGFFVNPLVFRTDFSGDPTFLEVLDRVRADAAKALVHQDLPFEKLVEELQPERSLNQSPIFQVVFAFQSAQRESINVAGIGMRRIEIPTSYSRFDLCLFANETNKGLRLRIEYSTELFERQTVERYLRHYINLLHAIAADAEAHISRLSMLEEEERRKIVHEWNDTRTPYTPVCLHELFERTAERQPDATAVVCQDRVLTYGDLNGQSNRLARTFRQGGARRGRYVAIYLERRLEMISALLGTLKCGAAYVPIDPSYPAARVQFMLNTLETPVLVTSKRHLEKSLELSRETLALRLIVCLDDLSAEQRAALQVPSHVRVLSSADLGRVRDQRFPSSAVVDDVAYVIFTSGSTGTPKGVVVSHRPVANLIEWVAGRFQISSRDRVLLVSSLCFDLSVYDIFGLLSRGGSIQILPDEQVRDPEAIVETLVSEPITFWDSAPGALQQLVPLLDSESRAAAASLRLVFLSGDWIPVTLPDRLRTAFPKTQVIALGGATEATVWSNFYPVHQVDPAWPSIPYGKPIQNARYYVLDKYLDPCPIGVPGYLYIAGDCLSSGYANEPALTAAKFGPEPFGNEPGARMYDTGDRAQLLPDGNIEFLGRRDFQVKIRGFRIELGEIEAALRQQDAIEQVFVIDREDAPGQKRLVAYYTVKHDASVRIDREGLGVELGQLADSKLPDYMRPTAYVMLDAMPVTPNGKLDRKELPPPECTAPLKKYEAPKTAEERFLPASGRTSSAATVSAFTTTFSNAAATRSLACGSWPGRAKPDCGFPREIFSSGRQLPAWHCKRKRSCPGTPRSTELCR